MSYRIDELEGLTPSEQDGLEAVGICTTGELLATCSTEDGRRRVADESGLAPARILACVHLADLMRIDGVGRQYAELLGESGAATLVCLRRQRPNDLADRVRRVNRRLGLAKTTPSPSTIERWVDEARLLPPRVYA